ncbi:VWA domain-containing protein [Ghiorsea bivora]|uniref:VWA domain-containing protein n=1 Tax=Ghiorsea bivora TaxID=1485545 RepID=UPI00068ECFC5|nr:VWA domain-containing protein [Ghiorsea bivora]
MMDFLHNFHFLRPWMWLLLIPALALLYARNQQAGMGAWQKLVAPELLAYLQVGQARAASKSNILGLAMLLILMVGALAGPVWQKLPQPIYSQDSALVVLLDLSASMNAQDIKPDRLTRAKQKLTDLLHQRKEGQTALVVFAGSAFVVTPLTDDNATILSQLQGLTTDIMPVQGGDIDAGLVKAKQMFVQASMQRGNILLLTDSDIYSESMVKQVTQAGFHIHVIGVGTLDGAPIPQAGGGFISDASGRMVIAKLDEQRLQHLALLGQGAYHRLSIDDSDITMLTQPSVQERLQASKPQTDARFDVWQEEGHWLLLLVIPLLVLMFRRGALLMLCFMLWQPAPSDAGVWQDLWQTPDQQAQALMQQKDYAKAYQTFENPAWKAAAAYRNQDYQAAVAAFKQMKQPQADDWYNYGNALARVGKLDEAIAAYQQTLKLNPNHADAQANKTLVEKLKEQQEQQQDKDEDKKQDSEKQGDSKQGDGGQSQKKQQEQKDKSQQGKTEEQQQAQQGQQGKQGQDQQQAQQQSSNSKNNQDKEGKPTKAAQMNQDQGDAKEKDKQAQALVSDEQPKSEAQQAFEQTLRRVPDDPSGLLRRKFLYQYQRQAGQVPQRGQAW